MMDSSTCPASPRACTRTLTCRRSSDSASSALSRHLSSLRLIASTHHQDALLTCACSFFYITGVNIPDCAATYDIATDKLTLWIPYVEPRQALYFGSPPDPAKAEELYDVDDVRYTIELPEFIRDRPKPSKIYVLHLTHIPKLGLEGLRRAGFDHQSLQPAMNRARVIKTAYEVEMIRKACQVSAAGHRRVAEQFLGLGNERDVEALFTAVCTTRGSNAMAYAVIAGAGVNAATLHYIENNQPLEGNELMVMDAGCEWNGYASDITRTLPISGTFKGKAAQIHSIVQDMQEACIRRALAGKKYYDLNVLAARIAVDGLLELGILKGDREAIWNQGTVGAFFPHGLGHHVGLEVHDVHGDSPLLHAWDGAHAMEAKKEAMTGEGLLRLMGGEGMFAVPRQALEPNMIVTIEPGM